MINLSTSIVLLEQQIRSIGGSSLTDCLPLKQLSDPERLCLLFRLHITTEQAYDYPLRRLLSVAECKNPKGLLGQALTMLLGEKRTSDLFEYAAWVYETRSMYPSPDGNGIIFAVADLLAYLVSSEEEGNGGEYYRERLNKRVMQGLLRKYSEVNEQKQIFERFGELDTDLLLVDLIPHAFSLVWSLLIGDEPKAWSAYKDQSAKFVVPIHTAEGIVSVGVGTAIHIHDSGREGTLYLTELRRSVERRGLEITAAEANRITEQLTFYYHSMNVRLETVG